MVLLSTSPSDQQNTNLASNLYYIVSTNNSRLNGRSYHGLHHYQSTYSQLFTPNNKSGHHPHDLIYKIGNTSNLQELMLQTLHGGTAFTNVNSTLLLQLRQCSSSELFGGYKQVLISKLTYISQPKKEREFEYIKSCSAIIW